MIGDAPKDAIARTSKSNFPRAVINSLTIFIMMLVKLNIPRRVFTVR